MKKQNVQGVEKNGANHVGKEAGFFTDDSGSTDQALIKKSR